MFRTRTYSLKNLILCANKMGGFLVNHPQRSDLVCRILPDTQKEFSNPKNETPLIFRSERKSPEIDVEIYKIEWQRGKIILSPSNRIPLEHPMTITMLNTNAICNVFNHLDLPIYLDNSINKDKLIIPTVPISPEIDIDSRVIDKTMIRKTLSSFDPTCLDFHWGRECFTLRFPFDRALVQHINSTAGNDTAFFCEASACWLIDFSEIALVNDLVNELKNRYIRTLPR